VHAFRKLLARWRRPAQRPHGLVVIGATDTEIWTPLTLPEPSQSVPGPRGQGGHAGVALCTTPAPSMADVVTRYQHLLADAPPDRLSAPARLITIRKGLPDAPPTPRP
jgi:hypothetical protein